MNHALSELKLGVKYRIDEGIIATYHAQTKCYIVFKLKEDLLWVPREHKDSYEVCGLSKEKLIGRVNKIAIVTIMIVALIYLITLLTCKLFN